MVFQLFNNTTRSYYSCVFLFYLGEIMSKEMDSIKNLKVSDVFDLTKVSFPASYTDDQVRVAGRAIANYDRMADEIAELCEVLSNVILDCEKVITNLTNTGCDEAWSIIKLNNIIDDCKLPLSPTCNGCDGDCEITDTFDVVWPCPECHGSGKMLNK